MKIPRTRVVVGETGIGDGELGFGMASGMHIACISCWLGHWRSAYIPMHSTIRNHIQNENQSKVLQVRACNPGSRRGTAKTGHHAYAAKEIPNHVGRGNASTCSRRQHLRAWYSYPGPAGHKRQKNEGYTMHCM